MSTKPELLSLDTFQLKVGAAGGALLPYCGYVGSEIKIPFLQPRTMYVPVLVVSDMQYSGQVPVIIGTNIIRACRNLSCKVLHISEPSEWDSAFEVLQNNVVGVDKSTNRGPLNLWNIKQ